MIDPDTGVGAVPGANVNCPGISATPFIVSLARTVGVVAPLKPLTGPNVSFTASIGDIRRLVKVQAMSEPGAVAAAFRVTEPVARFGVAVPPAPRPVQLTLSSTQLAGIVSVSVVALVTAARTLVAPVVVLPALGVVMICAAPKPLSPLNVKLPEPLFDVFDSVMVGSLAFVTVHAMLLPGATAAAFSCTVRVEVLTVAVPPAPIPVQLAPVIS